MNSRADPDERQAVESPGRGSAPCRDGPGPAEGARRRRSPDLPRPGAPQTFPPGSCVGPVELRRRAWPGRGALWRRYAPWCLGGMAAGIRPAALGPRRGRTSAQARRPRAARDHAKRPRPRATDPRARRHRRQRRGPSAARPGDRPDSATLPSEPSPPAPAVHAGRRAIRPSARLVAPSSTTLDGASSSSPTVIGEPAEQQVVSLVERTTHHEFYKITVSQGIVIDPRHPDGHRLRRGPRPADLEPFGCASFRDSFKDRRNEHEIDPPSPCSWSKSARSWPFRPARWPR